MIRKLVLLSMVPLATYCLLIPHEVYSQTGVPQLINYQGRLDSNNTLINGTRLMTFKIYSDSAGMNTLWTESSLSVTVTNGVFSVLLGSPTAFPAGLFAGTGDRYLGITVGSGSELTPRFRFTSVAYSMQAGAVAAGAVVKSVNTLKDSVTLVAGTNVIITPAGNNLTISAAGGGGGGTVTSVGTGAGLTGGPITTTGTISVATGGVTSAMIQDATITGADIANTTIGANNLNFTPLTGSGTANFVPKYTGSGTLGNSSIFESGGNVGFGTATPAGKLDIIGSDWGNNPMVIRGIPNDNGATLDMDASNSTNGRRFSIMSTGPLAVPGAGYFGLWDNNGSAFRYVVDPTGDFGIGTTNPIARLQVSGNGRYAGYLTSDSLSTATNVLYSQFTGTGSFDARAVYGKSNASPNWGYGGYFEGGYVGTYGRADTTGVGARFGLWGSGANGVSNYGLYGTASGVTGSNNYGVYGFAGGTGTNYAGYFSGNVNVTGTLSKGGGSFKIDHPLDPANKYLYHSFVESPDMKNIYDGLVILDGNGQATVELSPWFEALNGDFRYQLTAVGMSAPELYVAQEMLNNTFKIAGGKPGMKVSWQITGIRRDPFANAHRIQVEVEKPLSERGKYIHPVERGLGESMGVDYQNAHPEKKENQ